MPRRLPPIQPPEKEIKEDEITRNLKNNLKIIKKKSFNNKYYIRKSKIKNRY